MKVTNIHQAKTQLSQLIEQVRQGEEIIIGKAGKPVAKLVPYEPTAEPRRGGQWRGQIRIADGFDELPEDLAAAFRGESP